MKRQIFETTIFDNIYSMMFEAIRTFSCSQFLKKKKPTFQTEPLNFEDGINVI